MIPRTHNLEKEITKFEIEDEIQATKIKKTSYLTPVKIHEILKQNAEEHEGYVEGINVENVNKDVTNVKEHGIDTPVKNVNRMMIVKRNIKNLLRGYRRGKQPRIVLHPTKYWVQIALDYSGSAGDSSPLSYDSDSNSFVLIVFSLVAVMLAITAAFVGYVYYDEYMREIFAEHGIFLFIAGFLGLMLTDLCLMCSHCARVLPFSIFILIFGVCSMSLIAAFVTIKFSTDVVLYAMCALIVVFLLCLILACTSFDFTRYWLYFIAVSVAFMSAVLVIGIAQFATGTYFKPLRIALLIGSILISIVMIIMQLQMILRGRTIELNEDDYALGAFLLYIAVIDLFLKLLDIIGLLDED